MKFFHQSVSHVNTPVYSQLCALLYCYCSITSWAKHSNHNVTVGSTSNDKTICKKCSLVLAHFNHISHCFKVITWSVKEKKNKNRSLQGVKHLCVWICCPLFPQSLIWHHYNYSHYAHICHLCKASMTDNQRRVKEFILFNQHTMAIKYKSYGGYDLEVVARLFHLSNLY